MKHVLVETNWIIDVAAPRHHQRPVALELLGAAARGELILHVPSICFIEARRTIPTKFQPRNEAGAIRDFLGRAREAGEVNEADAHVTYQVLSRFESSVRQELDQLDQTFQKIRGSRNVQVFPLNEKMLALSVELSFRGLQLQPFDQGVLAAVLGRAEELRTESDAEVVFCERDGDLLPWDRHGHRKQSLASLYDEHHVWVYGDFDLAGQPPEGWPGGSRAETSGSSGAT